MIVVGALVFASLGCGVGSAASAGPTLVVVPGGLGTRPLLGDERLLSWLRAAHEALSWTTSVCTGLLLLGAAGLLDDTDAPRTGSSSTRCGSRRASG